MPTGSASIQCISPVTTKQQYNPERQYPEPGYRELGYRDFHEDHEGLPFMGMY